MKTPGLLCEKNTWNYRSESISRLYNMFVSIQPKLSVVKSRGIWKVEFIDDFLWTHKNASIEMDNFL